jgi:hypothetical protein
MMDVDAYRGFSISATFRTQNLFNNEMQRFLKDFRGSFAIV